MQECKYQKAYFYLLVYIKQTKIRCKEISKVLIYLLHPTQWPIVPGIRAQWVNFFVIKIVSF